MKAWLVHHLHSLKTAADQFRATPLATLFTVLVIGVAVALPAGLFVLLDNLDRAAGGIKPKAELTLFLKTSVSEPQGRELAGKLAQPPKDGTRLLGIIAQGGDGHQPIHV